MNCIIIGYGKMGKAIESILLKQGHSVIATIDNETELNENEDIFDTADMAFEFSTPSTAYNNIKTCLKHKLPVVCGTTGWDDKLVEIKSICGDENALLYAPNFSIGINIFLNINAQLSKIVDSLNIYEINIEETHHIHKKDAPSGTALEIKRTINESMTNKSDIEITSHREGEVVGIHEVTYTSLLDTIELRHTAKTRDAFAYGAVMAANFLIDKKGIFNMQDVIKSLYICK